MLLTWYKILFMLSSTTTRRKRIYKPSENLPMMNVVTVSENRHMIRLPQGTRVSRLYCMQVCER